MSSDITWIHLVKFLIIYDQQEVETSHGKFKSCTQQAATSPIEENIKCIVVRFIHNVYVWFNNNKYDIHVL
jgi:hypothetical protein